MDRARTAHDANRQTSTVSTWWCVLEFLLIVAVFFAATGDAPPHVNESHYLSRFKHYWDPNWCRGDLFLESPDTQLVLIWLFGWVTRFVSLTAAAWIGRALAWAAIAAAWQRLSWRLVPRRFASMLSAALFIGLNHYLHLAGEWVVGGVEAKCFAYALVLLALREVIDERWNRTWLLVGAATAFHPLVGGWSVLLCGGVWVVDVWQMARHPHPGPLPEAEGAPEVARGIVARFAHMLPGLVAGGMIGLIGIVPAVMLTWGVPADVVAEAARIYVFDRLPHHLAPLTLKAEVTRRLTGHAILLAAMAMLWLVQRRWRALREVKRERQGHSESRSQTAHVVRNSGATGSASAESVLRKNATFGIGWRQLAHALQFGNWKHARAARTSPKNTLAEPVAPQRSSLSPLNKLVLFAFGAAALAGAGLAIEIALADQPLLAAKLLRYYWFRMTDFAASMAVALQITVLVVAALELRRAWALPALVGAITLAAWFPTSACWNRITITNSPSDLKIGYFPAWVEVCDWIAANTPPDALFITPRANVSFKWRTERPEVVNRKDIPQDARGIVEWSRRLKDIYSIEYAGKPLVLDSVCALGTDRVRELALKYHASYVLSDRLELLDLPVVFANEDYVVYRIEDRSPGDGR